MPTPSAQRRIIARGPLALLILFAAAAAAEQADPVFTVRMQGYAAGTGTRARRQATENARAEAMRTVLESMAGAEKLDILRPILRNRDNYIRDYDMLRQDAARESTRVELDIHFREEPLRQDVAAIMLPRLVAPPEVLLVLGDQLPGDSLPALVEGGVAEAILKKTLEEYRFSVHGIEKAEKRHSLEELIHAAEGKRAACLKIALDSRCGAVVIGNVAVKAPPATGGGNVQRCRAEAVLRVFRGRDGKQMDEFTATAAVYSASPVDGGEQAIADATRKLAGKIIVSAVLTMLQIPDEDGVLLTIYDHQNRDTLNALIAAVARMPGTAGTDELFYSDTLARIQAEYHGGMAWFADAITGFRHGDRKLTIQRVVGRNVTASFR
jgi:hypothetical protein